MSGVPAFDPNCTLKEFLLNIPPSVLFENFSEYEPCGVQSKNNLPKKSDSI
jgi:hypothetical protein